MKKYPAEHWERLGRWVYEARMQTIYRDTQGWAEIVGRSSRVLLGLERGEPVGPKTIEAVAEALGVAAWALFAILTTGKYPDDLSEQAIRDHRETYEKETGLELPDEYHGMLSSFTSDELLKELAHRLKAADTPRAPWVRVAKAWPDGADLSEVDETLPAAAKEDGLEESGEF